MDKLSVERRSELMSRVRSKNTTPELLVRSLAHRLGFRFRLHRTDLPGCPDVVFPGLRRVIFVHGCFWHQHSGCPRAKRPETRREFWDAKLNRNIARDGNAAAELKRLGWNVLTIWECQTKDRETLTRTLSDFLGSPTRFAGSG